MAREIKFRAKYFDEWYFGVIVTRKAKDKGRMRNIYILMGLDNENWIPLNEDQYDTIGQFTSLHDKNGKEIYEGDILHVIAETDDIYDYITQVSTNGFYEVDLVGCEYDFTTLAWLSPSYDDCCTIEVIGNIYDNPELLKQED